MVEEREHGLERPRAGRARRRVKEAREGGREGVSEKRKREGENREVKGGGMLKGEKKIEVERMGRDPAKRNRRSM